MNLRRLSPLVCAAAIVSGCSGSGTAPPQSQQQPLQPAASRHAQRKHVPPSAGVSSAEINGYGQYQRNAEAQRIAHQRARHVYSHAAVHRVSGHTNHFAAVSGSASTLVLYDTDGAWGYLGELYAMATANLASHFGAVDAEPVTSYVSGQIAQHTAAVYIGSTYESPTADPLPQAFYADVASGTRPVIWMNDNIWNFAYAIGAAQFESEYGWDPTTSYFAPGGSVGDVTQVQYKAQMLTRTIPAGNDGGILHPNVLNVPSAPVSLLATASDASTGTTFPWAIRSGNLTYIGEVPFEYVNETDRVIALEDLLFDALAPNTAEHHRAMVRLEDISAGDDPSQVLQVARYLHRNGIPYGFNVIPFYRDPLGAYSDGVDTEIHLKDAKGLVNAITWMLKHGGTMVDEGYTHQYSNAINPYTGASGDDAEFFLAHIDASNNVVWDGPVPGDSRAWAAARVASALQEFRAARLPVPALWVTPHYYASDVDYRAIDAAFPARYDRTLYFSGLLSGTVNDAQYIGEFFPYVVKDVYGEKVLPENLGDYEPVPLNNHPVRLPADLIHEAQLNLAVRDGFASFFYDPSYGVAPLQTTVEGIKRLGYTFVSPASL